MNTNKALVYKEYLLRENVWMHAPYNPEFAFYEAVKSGDLTKVQEMNQTPFGQKEGFGMLAKNELQSMKYHFVITCALLARFCIEGGMEHELAYSLSDLYISECDACLTIPQISDLHSRMTFDYTKRMKALRKAHVFTKPVSMCIDYIYNNLHKRITIDMLSSHVALNPAYLSRLFKHETGLTITDYIRQRKIETAQNMLKYSDYRPSQIATLLAFPSQSYFIEVFRKLTGVTPKTYRDLSYRETNLFLASDIDATAPPSL